MLRMIGPHQGIRLERLRAELDDSLEARIGEALSSSAGKSREASMPPLTATGGIIPPHMTEAGVHSADGYEWLTREDGTSWYRRSGMPAEWELWNG